MGAIRTLDDLDVAGKTVLVRLDLNVPVDNGVVGDRTRIERSVPTLTELLDRGAAIVLLSHFGRPKGRPVPDMSLAPVADAVAEATGKPVRFIADDWHAQVPDRETISARPGEIVLLENTRFHPGEEANDPDFAGTLASLGDLYVNDAFSAAHRAHASTEGIARLLPGAAGRAMQTELDALALALETPDRPVIAVVGGAKISTKIELLESLSSRVDAIVIGGGMANTFLAAAGFDVGKSLCEHDLKESVTTIMDHARSVNCDIILPIDAVVAEALAPDAPSRNVSLNDVGPQEMILDIGENTVSLLKARFRSARTVLWNGPLGAFEVPPFDAATNEIARFVAEQTLDGNMRSVAGGGDTVAALNNAGAAADFTYVSTAGGAFLEWLEGKALPGVDVLSA